MLLRLTNLRKVVLVIGVLLFVHSAQADLIAPLIQSRCMEMIDEELWVATDLSDPHVTRGGFILIIDPTTDNWRIESFDMPVLSIEYQNPDIWLGTYGAGVYRYRNGDWTQYTVNSTMSSNGDRRGGLISDYVNAALPCGNRLFCATELGLSVLEVDQGAWKSYDPMNSNLPAHTVFTLANAKGQLWAATSDYGKAYYCIGYRDIASDEYGGLVRIDLESNVWRALKGSRIRVSRDKNTSMLLGEIPVDNSNTILVALDSLNRTWFSHTEGVGIYDNGKWTLFETIQDSVTLNHVIDIEASHDAVWIATNEKLCRLDNADSNWTVYDLSSGTIPGDYIQSLYVFGEDVWLKSSKVFYPRTKGWTDFEKEFERRKTLKEQFAVLKQGRFEPRRVEFVSRYRDGKWRSWELTSMLIDHLTK